MIAARAAFGAGFIQDEKSLNILMLPAQSNIIQVRLKAAGTIRNLDVSSVERVSEVLRNDVDRGVRRIALKSMGAMNREKGTEKDR